MTDENWGPRGAVTEPEANPEHGWKFYHQVADQARQRILAAQTRSRGKLGRLVNRVVRVAISATGDGDWRRAVIGPPRRVQRLEVLCWGDPEQLTEVPGVLAWRGDSDTRWHVPDSIISVDDTGVGDVNEVESDEPSAGVIIDSDRDVWVMSSDARMWECASSLVKIRADWRTLTTYYGPVVAHALESRDARGHTMYLKPQVAPVTMDIVSVTTRRSDDNNTT